MCISIVWCICTCTLSCLLPYNHIYINDFLRVECCGQCVHYYRYKLTVKIINKNYVIIELFHKFLLRVCVCACMRACVCVVCVCVCMCVCLCTCVHAC